MMIMQFVLRTWAEEVSFGVVGAEEVWLCTLRVVALIEFHVRHHFEIEHRRDGWMDG
jgi:hypothetical protein